MMHVEHITPLVKITLKLQCQSQVYVIIVMHIYLSGAFETRYLKIS